MARRGIYWRLRDPTTPWSDRIKLLRYAWRHQSVHIPNKHQVLLDWLTLSLTGKKRVPVNEAEGPWRCLCDMLWSRVCQKGTGTRTGLIIKNVVGQVLLDELRGQLPGGRSKSGAGVDTLMSCVEAILTSHSLQHVYTNRIDTMMQLLAVTCDLCVQDVETGDSPSSQKVALLNLLLATLGQTQWRRVNVQQALTAACNRLLLSAARFTHTLTQLNTQRTQLCDFICQAVFHIDLWEHYQLYIGAKATSSSATQGSSLPKDVEVMFKVTETLLQDQENRKYILNFLPVLYKGFLNAYQVRGTQSGMHLLILLTTLLGINLPPQGQTEVKGQLEVKGQDVMALTLLLEVAVQHEVYDVSYGSNAEERQLPWLQRLAGCLLSMTDKSVSWYDSLHHLVAMDHTIVETSLAELFTAAWVNVEDLSTEQQTAQGRLLGELVTLYGRLRRFPVMIERCLTALRDRSVATPLYWPQQFTNSLISVIAALPANSCVTLWRTLVTELTSHYLTQGQKAALAGEAGVAQMLGTLLSHAHLADYNVPHQVAALVRELLQMTSQDVTNVMLLRTLKEPRPDFESVLSLTTACGNLRLLLVQFTPLSLGASTTGVSPCWTDMTLVHPGVAAADWAAICKRAKEMNDAKGLHLIDELAMQKLRAVLLQEMLDSETRHEAVQNVASHLLHRLTAMDIDTSGVWDGQIAGIDESNWQVALLELVCRHMTLLVPVWSDAQNLQFVQLVVNVVLQPDTQTKPQDHINIYSVASDVLGGATWNELATLQSAVVTVVLDRLGQLCQPATSQKKKRRSSMGPGSGSQLAAGLLNALSDTNTRWQHLSADDSEVADTLQTVSDGVTVLLTSDDEQFTITATQDALKLLKILDRLPLEHFTPLNKARCILGQLVVTSTKQSELVSASLSQLSVLMDSADASVSIRSLDPGTLLLWLLTTADDDGKSLSLRDDVIFNVLKQATKGMDTTQLLKPFLTQCHLVVTQAGQGDAASTHQMSLVAKTLGTLRTVVERAHQEAALRGVCVTYFTELAASTLNLLTQSMARPGKRRTVVLNSALKCYRHALDHECHIMRRRQQIRQQRKAARKAEKMEVDKKEKEEKDAEDSDQEPEPSNSSDEASSTADSEESEDDDGSQTLRATLRSQLPTVCDTLQNILSNTQDAKSFSSCLPLVSTICTNYAHLKRHLPDNFCHDVLSLVLNMLHSDETPGEHAISATIPDNPYCQQVWSVLGKGSSIEEAMETDIEGAERDLDDNALGMVRQTAVAIMASLNSEQFSVTLHQLLGNLSVECLQQSPSKVVATLCMLQELLDAKLEDDTSQILKYACHNVLVPIQDVLSTCGRTALTNATRDVISTALATVTKMLAFGPSLLSSRSVSVCLHGCQYVPLDAVTDITTFNTFHQRAYEVLNAMLIHHEKSVFGFIPAFIQASKRLMTSVIVQSDQSRPGLTAADTEILVTCALRIYRLYSLIATHKVNFTKVAAYMVADYIDNIQRVTVLPKVKKSLVSAVHKVMDLCDEHAVRMLSTVLPPSGREIFRTLHTEFTRYHRYRGRV